MDFQINITQDGIVRYPMHTHKSYEIMVYLAGTGYLKTPNKDYEFSPGSVIIVPPDTPHGSVSKSGFKNISIEGSFEKVLHYKDVTVKTDNKDREAVRLAEMIYNNRFKNAAYLAALCAALVRWIASESDNPSDLNREVDNIIYKISENFFDSEIDLNDILKQSGYAPDYIRAHFKRITEKTPCEFLNGMRIKHARFLIEVYSKNVSLSEVAERCGYNDYVYFSKKFKAVLGVSPSEYKRICTDNKFSE